MFKRIDIQFEADYPIYIGTELFETQWIDYCKTLTQRLVMVTDSNLVNSLGENLKNKLLAANIDVELLCIPAGETNKTRETKQQLEDCLFARNYGRDTCLIALGGGVVTDLAGFVAATYCRGISVMYLPTTLLAMVDASIGGKTGVDTPYGKNLVGAFYQPQAVFMDLDVLKTLPENEFRNGMVEVLKHALIKDAAFFRTLQAHVIQLNEQILLLDIIYASCLIKKEIIEQDEKDHGIRQLLNFGHTIGHAIESIEAFKVSHGEAVAIGMIVEAYISALSGSLEMSIVTEIEQTLRDYHLPLKTDAFIDLERFKQALGLDKKALKNQPFFVLLDSIGHAHEEKDKLIFSVDSVLLEQALTWARIKFS